MIDLLDSLRKITSIKSFLRNSPWWLLIVPGVVLLLLSFAIFIWPTFFAYSAAMFLLIIGGSLVGVGWYRRPRSQLPESSTTQIEYIQRG